MIDLGDKSVLVVGLGFSGYQSARVLSRLGAAVTVVDSSMTPVRLDGAEELASRGVDVRLGVDVPGDLGSFELLVTSPGVPEHSDVLTAARAKGLRVISELELAYRLLEGNTMVAVTGTNGKTTTTSLIAAMLDEPGRRAFPCGNIGEPLVGFYGRAAPEDILVVEVSSFQLANIEEFRAGVSVLLNIAPDHFDWHRDMSEYLAAKARLVENARPVDFLVYNMDDGFCREIGETFRGRAVGFSSRGNGSAAVSVKKGSMVTGDPLSGVELMPVGEIALKGVHNLQNAMAAAGAALAMGGDVSRVRDALSSFAGLRHRMELIGEFNGVSFYDDSKATNPHATLGAIASFDSPLVLIMGGRNKGLDFTELGDAICGGIRAGTVRGLVLMGEAAEEIQAAVTGCCGEEAGALTVRAGDMKESVSMALEFTGGRGSVLLSPACASFDMYEDYAERGRDFARRVKEIAGGEG